MPEIGELKRFANGRVGRFDGTGFEDVTEAASQPSPQQPPPAPVDPSAEPQERGMLSRFLTGVGAPAVGLALGGALGGPPGAALGAMAGKAYGDLGGMMLGDTPPDPVEETIGLAGTGAGTLALGAAAPYLQRLPGPFKLANVGLGAAGGYGAGQSLGHPGLGAAIGGAMGGYNLLRGALGLTGRAAETLMTPRFGGAAAAAEEPLAAAVGNPKVGQHTLHFTPEQAEQFAGYTADGRPRFGAGGPQPAGPAPAQPMLTPQVPNGIPNGKPPVSGMPNGAPPIRPTIPPSMAAPQLERTPATEALSDLSERLGVRGIQPTSELPSAARNPELQWNADVTASPMRERQLIQSSPTQPDMEWSELASRSQPRRSVPKSFGGVDEISTTMSRTPDEALQGLSQANDMPNGGPKKPAKPFKHREYPSKFNPAKHGPDDWNRLGADDAEAEGSQAEVERIKKLIRRSLDSNKP